MTINKTGITRTVIVLKHVVIKIPNHRYSWRHFLQGILANINENDTYTGTVKYYPERLHLICPVLCCSWGGWLLVMKRADMAEQCDYSEHIKYFKGDDKPDNYGMYQGKLVKIDYGQ